MKAICETPILPQYHAELLNVSLIKGAQATTAIEGNTLSEEEIELVRDGGDLPQSKEYQQIEVKNILNAFNKLLGDVVDGGKEAIVSPELIKEFHRLVGKDLGVHLDASPGKFREDNRVVGTYRCPDYEDVPGLIDVFCDWLREEFHFEKGQSFHEVLIQAIVAHVYLEWIHPFGDGNGRTGRLLEFYILMRGGNPSIASHILSNHYNLTRPEYYRQLEMANKKRDLTSFLEYALVGLRDGLASTLSKIQRSQRDITWQKLIYDKFDERKMSSGGISTFKRQRKLVLSFPTDKDLLLEEALLITPELALEYGRLNKITLKRDLKVLIEMELMKLENKMYSVRYDLLKGYFAKMRKPRSK